MNGEAFAFFRFIMSLPVLRANVDRHGWQCSICRAQWYNNNREEGYC